MLQALTAAALTGLVTGVGAFPFFFIRQLPRRAYDGILGLGAGLMLAAATLGLLHEALEGVSGADGLDLGRLALVIAGFAAGVLECFSQPVAFCGFKKRLREVQRSVRRAANQTFEADVGMRAKIDMIQA